jgi:hypothetical protein
MCWALPAASLENPLSSKPRFSKNIKHPARLVSYHEMTTAGSLSFLPVVALFAGSIHSPRSLSAVPQRL